MTAVLRSEIPNDALESLDALATWALTALSEINFNVTVAEGPGEATLAAQASPFIIANSGDVKWYTILRATVELDADWRSQGRMWSAAKEISSTPLPSRFKAV